MKRDEPFSAIGIAVFAVAAWQDGAIWTSGVCAGVAGCCLFEYAFTKLAAWAERS